MNDLQHLPIFVYGTLKTGEERAHQWPVAPKRIEPAVARGALYDLGPYPALTEGSDAVLGELWHIGAEHLLKTITVLDRIEGFGTDDIDLYVRRITPVTVPTAAAQEAYAYFIADPATLSGSRRVVPNREGYCTWSRR
jgi:gamma-glutamylcyclotransferase (GGCT)/AIG2-like uncharacterized protein YtfP